MSSRDGITPQILAGHYALKSLGYLGAITTTRKEWVEVEPGVEVEQEVTKVFGPFGAGEMGFTNIGRFSDKQMAAVRASMIKREDEIFMKGSAS